MSDKTERDPRETPCAGDVLIYGPQWQLERCEVTGTGSNNTVWYRMNGTTFSCPLKSWRDWMRGAEVVVRAEERKA